MSISPEINTRDFKLKKKNNQNPTLLFSSVHVGGMSGLVCCGLQVRLRSTRISPSAILSCVHTAGAGKALVALPSLLSLAPTPWLSQQGRGASFLPGCLGPRGITSPGCPCQWSSTPRQPYLPQPCPSRAGLPQPGVAVGPLSWAPGDGGAVTIFLL